MVNRSNTLRKYAGSSPRRRPGGEGIPKTHATAPRRQRRERCSLVPPLNAGKLEEPNGEDAPRRPGSRTGKLVFLSGARSEETRADRLKRTA
ncbi:hypothetical protein NDU88_011075 [Pleurodeles waltl]|uniref:Uncharacterized protein n=1 Tax=Pleurodeles waltl TaxID=8319 RepID=A0AAV7S2H0_PLEWA|nr:hypothetical protein NDU88_011075 [Pleurodeles waltl]